MSPRGEFGPEDAVLVKMQAAVNQLMSGLTAPEPRTTRKFPATCESESLLSQPPPAGRTQMLAKDRRAGNGSGRLRGFSSLAPREAGHAHQSPAGNFVKNLCALYDFDSPQCGLSSSDTTTTAGGGSNFNAAQPMAMSISLNQRSDTPEKHAYGEEVVNMSMSPLSDIGLPQGRGLVGISHHIHGA